MCCNQENEPDVTSSVSSLRDPFDLNCGLEPSSRPVMNAEDCVDRSVEVAVVKAMFQGNDSSRRMFMKLAGSASAMAVISTLFPMDMAKCLAKESPGPLEKKDLKIGFVPITCATPLLAADAVGMYRKHGLDGTELVKAKSWTMIRDWGINKEVACSHMLSPMPLALTIGADSQAVPFTVPAIQNINGQALTLHLKHKDVKGPADMKGFTLAVPFEYSMHNFLLRYYLAEAGIDPDKDVTITVLPPPQMVLYLKQERINGYLAPDPFNQRAVHDGTGFIFKLSKEIWPGHPCCVFAAPAGFVTEMPNSFKAVFDVIVEATMYAHKSENRKEIAKLISGEKYLNQPTEVVEQVLTGRFPDGLGRDRNEPDRIDFNPFPWQSMAVWILTQMKRWGYIKGTVKYSDIANKVFLAAECGSIMKKQGFAPPEKSYAKHTIMGKEFNPDDPQDYLNGFAIGLK
ncbi:MAG: CmpA/NrtA family ABC transporter substrate-binding protein [Pseudomonadota bacterium]